MLGTTGATIVCIVYLVFACVLGTVAGGLTCLALRRRWSPKDALIDAVLTGVVAFFSAYVEAEIDIARGVWGSNLTLILAVAIGSVVLRHLLRLALRSRK
jgi:hypothetical protein